MHDKEAYKNTTSRSFTRGTCRCIARTRKKVNTKAAALKKNPESAGCENQAEVSSQINTKYCRYMQRSNASLIVYVQWPPAESDADCKTSKEHTSTRLTSTLRCQRRSRLTAQSRRKVEAQKRQWRTRWQSSTMSPWSTFHPGPEPSQGTPTTPPLTRQSMSRG
jgi:hypothetical protein